MAKASQKPRITKVTPANPVSSPFATVFTIGGRHFKPGMVLFLDNGPAILTTGITPCSCQATAVFATPQSVSLTVRNPNGVISDPFVIAVSGPAPAPPPAPEPPLAPTALVATPGDAQIALAAQPSVGALSYAVYRGLSSGGETFLESGLPTPNYVDLAAPNGVTQFYLMTATGAGGESPVSNEASATPTATPVTPPPDPPVLVGTPGDGQFGLTWSAPAGATSYDVYKALSSGAEVLLVAGVVDLFYDDLSAGNGVDVFYFVRAVSGAGASLNSNEVHGIPHAPGPSPPPAVLQAPTGLVATLGVAKNMLAWTYFAGVAWSSVTAYIVGAFVSRLGVNYRCLVAHTNHQPPNATYWAPVRFTVKKGATAGSEVPIATNLTTPAYTDTDVVVGVPAFYVVVATAGATTSAASNEVTAAPLALAAPTLLQAVPGNARVTVDATASPGALGYILKRSTVSGAEVSIQSGATPHFVDLTAQNGTKYFYTMSATAGVNESPNSNEASATPAITVTIPTAPTNLQGSFGNASVDLTWGAASGLSLVYDVFRGTAPGAETILPAGTGLTSLSFADLTPTNGVHVYYVVRARNSAGSSVPSNEINGTPNSPPPAPPPGVDYGNYRPQMFGPGTNTRGAWGLMPGTPPVLLRVQNTNNSGAGSLREALEAAFPRVIVIETSGLCTLTSSIYITNSYFTLAGQCAPSPGFMVRRGGVGDDAMVEVNAAHGVIQHVDFWPGDTALCTSALGAYDETPYGSAGSRPHHIVLDHCNAGWGQDENLYLHGDDLTAWRCITAFGLNRVPGSQNCSGGGEGTGHGLILGWNDSRMAVIQCLFAHNAARNPELHGNTSALILNNLMYDFADDPTEPAGTLLYGVEPGPWSASIIGNAYLKGPNTPAGRYAVASWAGSAGSRLYLSDNYTDPGLTPYFNNMNFDPRVSVSPLDLTGIQVLPSSGIEAYVKARVGARPLDRNAIALRVIADLTNRTGHKIVSQNEVGGWPSMAENFQAYVQPSNPNSIAAGQTFRTNEEMHLEELALALEPVESVVFVPPPSVPPPSVPASRLVYAEGWTGLVGVDGGIPNRTTQFGATIAAYTGSAGTINTAIANCPDDQFVQLGAGTFNLSSAITLAKSLMTLRGAVDGNGVPTTILNFTGGSNRLIHIAATSWDLANSGQFTTVNVSAGVLRGSTTITLASTPTTLAVGQIMLISAPASAAVTPSTTLWSDLFGTRPFVQIVRVTAKNGTAVTFTPAINADYLSGTIQVHWRGLADSVKLSGIENLSLVRSGGTGHYVGFSGADECWAKNIKTYGVPASTYHIFPYLAYRCEIRHCDISHMDDTGSSTYCIAPAQSSQLFIEDNYFHDCPNVMPMFGMNGSAFTYNYINDLPYAQANWLSQIVYFHGSHSHYNLFEGNWCAASYNDVAGGSRNNLWFRNRMRGYDATGPKTANTEPLTLCAGHNNVALAGNVLGENGVQTVLQATFSTTDNAPGNAIYNIHTTPNTTLLKRANYNTVNDGIAAAEALSSGQTLIASYLHAAKPSWFGSLPWPWCDPSNFSQSNDFQNLPAGYRAANGVDP